MRTRVGVWMGFVLLGCGSDQPGPIELTPLIDHQVWELIARSDDPVPDAPDELPCDPQDYGVEGTGDGAVLEVVTTYCHYFAARQPSLTALSENDELELSFWHLDLFNPERAEAHAAIAIGDDIVWEERIPIPSQEGSYSPVWSPGIRAAKGTPIVFHLHNHGTNSWRFALLSVRRR